MVLFSGSCLPVSSGLAKHRVERSAGSHALAAAAQRGRGLSED
jgi:hypothetical protein